MDMTKSLANEYFNIISNKFLKICSALRPIVKAILLLLDFLSLFVFSTIMVNKDDQNILSIL